MRQYQLAPAHCRWDVGWGPQGLSGAQLAHSALPTMTASCHQRTPRPQPQEWRTQCTGKSRITQRHSMSTDPRRVTAPLFRGLQIPVPKTLWSLLSGSLRKDLTMGRAPTIIHFQVTHGPQQGSWAQKGDSPPSGVGHCCLLTLSSTGKLRAGKQSSSPDPSA